MCVHYWIVNGNQSTCRTCGQTKKEVTASEILYPEIGHRVRISKAERIRRNNALKEVQQLRRNYYMLPTV